MSSNSISADPFRDPGNETKVGIQADRETDANAFTNRPAPWKIGDVLGDFVLESQLGYGSSAWVYRVRDTRSNDRRLALKLLRPESPEKMLWNKQGFRRMISVDHPSLVRVELIHQLGDYVGLAMEEVKGRTLSKARRELLAIRPAIAYEKILSLLRQYASGMAVMHAHGLIHRDLKPANMMVDQNDMAKIIDYGLVEKFSMTPIDCSPRARILGTPRYIAPEVLWSQQYLPSGDIFCMGMVFLETLIGIQANAGLLVPEIERSKEEDEDQQRIDDAIEDLKDAVPSFIIDTCKQMLSRDPADRPQATELARLGQNESISVVLPTPDRIIGRHAELAKMTNWADSIFSGAVGRLHIGGPSGIGKSFLANQLVEYIESKNWGQLFHAKCRKREDQPMQAIDQICDAIAERYMQSDREPIIVDPVSASILLDGFPVLSSVLSKEIPYSPRPSTVQNDSLVAGERLTEQLRLVGPLFLVVDDAQWADRASRAILDSLSKAKGAEGLGIISVSRGEDCFRVPAQLTVNLDRLTSEESLSLLSQYADQWNVQVAPAALERLAAASEGNPFQLRALATEFRPGRSLAAERDSLDEIAIDGKSIEGIWKSRAENLSPEARAVLPFVITAGGRVSTKQLGELSGLKDSIDAAVSELAQQFLIRDEATGGECIQILHDRIAEELLASLSLDERQAAQQGWASHLARQDNAHQLAARIAGHFFAADQPGQALSHAILAAEDAERRTANYEAALLYQRVSEHVKGSEQVLQLRNAARCFRLAEFSAEAAECFRQIASMVDQSERIQCHFEAAALMTRAGHIGEVHALLRDVASEMRLPKRKPTWLAITSVLKQQLQLQIESRGGLFSKLVGDIDGQPGSKPEIDAKIKRKLELCFSLTQPLSFFDHLYAAELHLYGTRRLLKNPDTQLGIQTAVSRALQSCYDHNQNRIEGEQQLSQLQELASQYGNARSKVQSVSAIALSHGLAGRWDSVSAPAKQGVQLSGEMADTFGFSVAHIKWMNLWAMWHLGQWNELKQESMTLYYESVRRIDRFQQVLAHNGFSATAWLAEDNPAAIDRILRDNDIMGGKFHEFQLVDFFHWIGDTLRQIYEGHYDQAWDAFQAIRSKIRKRPFSDLQIVRIAWKQLGALTAFHQLSHGFSEPAALRVVVLIDQLRKEQTPFACLLADLYGGLLKQHVAQQQGDRSDSSTALASLISARDAAVEQRLVPFELVAADAIEQMKNGTPSTKLLDHMRNEKIAKPNQFQRLLTIDSIARTG